MAIVAHPVLLYGYVIDRPVPLDVGVVGDSVIIVSGFDDPAAPHADDVVEADPDVWQALLGRPDAMQVDSGERIQPVREGEDVVVELRNFTDVVLHPDAAFDSFVIDGRVRAESTVIAGSVGGVRISETSPADPFDVSVRITGADGEVLQTTDAIRLAPE